ncbi:hypothetical protein JX265_006091 [Neoarthrinium moseri]|uniref:Major facilitator superfamily (MFS) profile domain-containing protein n=1 Tax=Neoarthrinium moseri TaxID=1658444 RepID=A0A9Q0APL1_9PEZI|nr:hypothetical protein JX265_006091 [Neoarthrinium moseri]
MSRRTTAGESPESKPTASPTDSDETPKDCESGSKLEPTQTNGTQARKHATFRRRVTMLSLFMILFLAALDTTIVSTALPTIASTLGANTAQYAWVGSSYTLASTSSTPIWAKLSDVAGRKLALITANCLFLAGDVVAALAQSTDMLIAARALQGAGGGGIMVLITIIIGDLFVIEERAKYYGLTGVVFAIASSTGPILGGVFTQSVGWRWCFWIQLPVGFASLMVIIFTLQVEAPQVALWTALRSLDWTGLALIVGGVISFLYGLESGGGGLLPWSNAKVVAPIIVGLVVLLMFCAWEVKFAKQPLIPPRIFSSATNVAAFTLQCLHSFVFISYDYFLPLYFQAVLRFTPVISGVSLLALVVPLSCMTIFAGIFIRRTGNFLYVIWFGTTLMTLGTGLLIALGSSTSWAEIICYEIIIGIGTGPLFQAPMIALQSHIQQEDMSPAMSALSFTRNLFSTISIIVGSILIQSRLGTSSLTSYASSVTHGNDGTSTSTAAYVNALHLMWAFYTGISGLMLSLTFFIERGPKRTTISAKQ